MASGPSRQAVTLIHRFNAADKHSVGRLASQIATLLQGKHKPTFSPHLDNGDNVIVTNARKLTFTGRKYEDKLYKWHTGFPGGLKERTPRFFVEVKDRPEELLERAVKNMLPRNKLRSLRMQRLTIFKEDEVELEKSKTQMRREAWKEDNPSAHKFKRRQGAKYKK